MIESLILNINNNKREKKDKLLDVPNNYYKQLGQNLYELYKLIIFNTQNLFDKLEINERIPIDRKKSIFNLLCYLH